ncbi:MAG TPA: Crp/Fnr family transcriptional regulator [Burkholderiaceae bacterium]|jgi:CRP-like cAMP-binding protein
MLNHRHESQALSATESQQHASLLPEGLSPPEWQVLFGAPLLATELQGLESLQRLRRLSRGETVFTRQERARDLVAVISGTVGLGQKREDGSFDLQRNVCGPQWLDLSSAWLGGGHGQDAMALGDVQLVELPISSVRELLLQESQLSERLLAGLARTVRSLAAMSHDLVYKDAERRLAVWLLRRCQPSGNELLVPLSERKRDVAAQLGVTPETFSRSLKAMRVKNIIEVLGYTIRVINLPALQALAQDSQRATRSSPAH